MRTLYSWRKCFMPGICFAAVVLAAGIAHAAADIDPDRKFAWSENAGWLNWRATHGEAAAHVTGTDKFLAGYVWAENIGWIRLGDGNGPYANTDETNYGVNMDDDGNLSGYAWSEAAGWINFNPTHGQVAIDEDTGDFDGYAWGERIGWIHFKNDNPEYNVSIYKLDQTIDFPEIPDQLITNVVELTATATSGNEVDFTVESGAVERTNNTLSFTASGEVVVSASQDGDFKWHPAPVVTRTFFVDKLSQTIDFPAIEKQRVTNTVPLTATATSGFDVGFEVVKGPAVIADGVMTFTAPGVVSVAAFQDGDYMWHPAPIVVNTFRVIGYRTDFGGEGVSDVAVYSEAAGQWYILSPESGLIWEVIDFGGPGSIPVPGDYTGNGIADLVVYHEETGYWYGVTLDGELILWEEEWGGPGSIPVPGDYTGNGIADMMIYHEETGRWFGRTLDGAMILWEEEWGGPGAVPVPGDYTGNGKADMVIYHEETGYWFGRTLDGAMILWEEEWGGPGAVPVPGDYTGNGIADLVVYEEATGYWFGVTVDGALILWEEQWGGPGAVPVPGDFSGNGIADLAVYADGLWFVTTLDGTVLYWEDRWGGPESVPLGR